jgi:hypothetical protein
MRDTQAPGRIGYALSANGMVQKGRRVVDGKAVVMTKKVEKPIVYEFSECSGDKLDPAVCDSTAKILYKHLNAAGYPCGRLVKLMQVAQIQFTVASCTNLPAGMMYEVRPVEIKVVDFNTMRIDLLYAGGSSAP